MITFNEIRLLGQKVQGGQTAVNEKWLGPLPADIINLFEAENGDNEFIEIDQVKKMYENVYRANQNNASIQEVDEHMEMLKKSFKLTDNVFSVDGRYFLIHWVK